MITAIRLAYVNQYKEKFYFVSLGDPWPNNPNLFLVRRTTKHKAKATIFKNAEEAAAMMKLFDAAPGWAIDIEDSAVPQQPEKPSVL